MIRDIIEDIFRRTNLTYISELHEEENYDCVLGAVKKLKEQDYRGKDWKEAYQYTTRDCPDNSKNREGLISFLESRTSL